MDKKNILTIILGIILIILTILVCLGYTESFDTFCYNLVTFKMNDTWTNIFKVITFLGSTLFIILACLFFFAFFIFLTFCFTWYCNLHTIFQYIC